MAETVKKRMPARAGSRASAAEEAPLEVLSDGDRATVQHWIAVYTELIAFGDDLLQAAAELHRQHQDGTAVSGQDDEDFLQDQADRYRQRLDHWRRLATAGGSSPMPVMLAAARAARPWKIGHVVVDPERQEADNDGRKHRLTPTEWRLLLTLLQHPGTVFSRVELARALWGPGSKQRSTAVEVYISRLRAKIESTSPQVPRLIETVHGSGYRVTVPPTSPG